VTGLTTAITPDVITKKQPRRNSADSMSVNGRLDMVTDYKALAEQCISADSHAITSWFESGEDITCEALKQRQIEAVATVLKEALTPTWKDVPDELPEGAVKGWYLELLPCGQLQRFWRDQRCTHRVTEGSKYMLLLALDVNGFPVSQFYSFDANGEVVSP
jgi:hypothetical protein